jgi:hypothetical protein
VVCLAGDGDAEPKELCRVPFTEASVQRVLIVADPGAAPTDMDARISQFTIRAEEITHKIPKRDAPRDWGWWLTGAVVIGCAVGGFFIFRRIRHANGAGPVARISCPGADSQPWPAHFPARATGE